MSCYNESIERRERNMEENIIVKARNYKEFVETTILVDKIIKARAKVLKLQPDAVRAALILTEGNEPRDIAEALQIRQERATHLVRTLERNAMIETDRTAGGHIKNARLTSVGRKLLVEPIEKKVQALVERRGEDYEEES